MYGQPWPRSSGNKNLTFSLHVYKPARQNKKTHPWPNKGLDFPLDTMETLRATECAVITERLELVREDFILHSFDSHSQSQIHSLQHLGGRLTCDSRQQHTPAADWLLESREFCTSGLSPTERQDKTEKKIAGRPTTS